MREFEIARREVPEEPEPKKVLFPKPVSMQFDCRYHHISMFGPPTIVNLGEFEVTSIHNCSYDEAAALYDAVHNLSIPGLFSVEATDDSLRTGINVLRIIRNVSETQWLWEREQWARRKFDHPWKPRS